MVFEVIYDLKSHVDNNRENTRPYLTEYSYIMGQIYGSKVLTTLEPHQWADFCDLYPGWGDVPYFYNSKMGHAYNQSKYYFNQFREHRDGVDISGAVEGFRNLGITSLNDVVIYSADLSDSDEEEFRPTSIHFNERVRSGNLVFRGVDPCKYGLQTKHAVEGFMNCDKIVRVYGGGKNAFIATQQCYRFWKAGVNLSDICDRIFGIVAISYNEVEANITNKEKARGKLKPKHFTCDILVRWPECFIPAFKDPVATIVVECAMYHLLIHITSEREDACWVVSLRVQDELLRATLVRHNQGAQASLLA